MGMHTGQYLSAFARISHHVKLIGDLAVEPEFRAVAEIGGKTHRRISGNAALSGNDALNPTLGHAGAQRQARLAQAHGLQKFLIQDFARMNGRHAVMHHGLLMVVNDFNTVGVALTPGKADAPLAVDADAVLTGPVAFQGLQAISRRNAQVIQRNCIVQNFELAHCDALNVRRQAGNSDAQKEVFGPAVFVARDHTK